MYGSYFGGNAGYAPYNPDIFGRTAAPQMGVTQMGAQAPASSADIQWVQGEVGAKSFPVLPGHSALLMDSENPVFYIKTLDASGMPMPLRTFDYSERIAAQSPMPVAQPEVQFNPNEFVTKKEFEAFMARFNTPAEQGATNG